MITVEQKIKKIESLLQALHSLLLEHQGANYISGVLAVQDLLSNSAGDLKTRIAKAGQSFRGMYGGAGTIGDFAIWHENESTRLALNNELSDLISELWDEFTG